MAIRLKDKLKLGDGLHTTSSITAGNATFTGNVDISGTANFYGSGQIDTTLKINAPDGGGAPAMTAILDMHGYEGRGVGIKMKDNVNSANSSTDREWFVGTGYNQSGFNIGYAADGSQSSYAAQAKLQIATSGDATFSNDVRVTGNLKPNTLELFNQDSATLTSSFKIYGWGTELQFTKRNLSTGAHTGTLLALNYTTNAATFLGAITANNFSGTSSGTNTGDQVLPTLSSLGATPLNDIRSLGTRAFTNGSNPNITTAQVMDEIDSDGGFDSYSSVFKTSWSYAGNYNLTDAGRFTETAGSSWLTWTDNSSDSTRGNVTALAIAPTTGGSAGKVFIYNNQGGDYNPGWREVWTNTSDGAGSGLDADLLDGQQGSYYTNPTTLPTTTSNTFDFFQDNSAVSLHQFNNNLTDAGGNYNATATSGVSYATGLHNRFGTHGINTQGDGTYVDIAGLPTIQAVSLWYKAIGNDNGYIVDFRHDNPSNGRSYLYTAAGSDQYINIGNDTTTSNQTGDIWINGVAFTSGQFNFTSGNWYHIVITTNATNTKQTWDQGIRIGNRSDGTTSGNAGYFDQVRTFNRRLTSADVALLYSEVETGATADQTSEEILSLISTGGNIEINGNADISGNLFLGENGGDPQIDMMYTDHASGPAWDTRIFIGKSDNLPGGSATFPTYTPAGAYGIQFQANSDGAFFGMEEYTTGHYRPIIQWGDDNTDTPFRIKHENGSELEVSWDGNVTATTSFIAPILSSTVATGTPPLTVTSTTKVTNLNAHYFDGASSSYFLNTSSTGQTKTGALDVGTLKIDGKKVLDLPSNTGSERGPWNPIVTSIRGSGKIMHTDEEFANGSNGVSVYNNSGGTGVVITRETSSTTLGATAPNNSGYVLKIVHNGNATSPGHGGFISTIASEDNHTFVQIFQAKLDTGRSLVIAENAQGSDNASYWLTNTAGTGKWEWYARVSHCGSSGTFSSGGHVYVSGGTSSFTWYLASCTVIDVTDASELGPYLLDYNNFTNTPAIPVSGTDFVSAASGGNFGGNLNVHTGAGTGSLSVGRTSDQAIKLHVNDTVNTIFASQDSDGNGDHQFILRRDFQGTGASDFKIQNGGTSQLIINKDGNATFAGTLSATFLAASNSSGAANGTAQEMARIVNIATGATSSYIYIGASSGTDWRLGKNINGTTSNTNFGITKHSGTTLFLEIDGSGNTSIHGNLTSGGSLTAAGNLYLGSTGTENFIAFKGTTGDSTAGYTTTYIGEYLYGGTEQSELILYKGNDGQVSTASPDRIRLIGANLCFDVYNVAQTYPTTMAGVAGLATTRAMTILANGNVGIGTTDPERVLHLNADQGRAIIQLDKGGDKIVSIGTGSSATGADDTIFQMFNEGSELVRIFTEGNSWLNGGNIGIGTTSPAEKLQVTGKVYIESQGVDWNESTPGLTRGAIHLDPAGNAADHTGNAITFGASDRLSGTNAQAGIYTRSDGSYGSKMYFATTDSYATGAKTAMFIDYDRKVGIGTTTPATKLDVRITTSNRTTLEPVLTVSAQGNGPYTGFGPKISFNSNIYYSATTAGNIETAYIGAVMGPTYETYSDLVFGTRRNATTVDEKMRITGGGYVGIGGVPKAWLHIKKTQSYGSLRISPTSNNGESAMAFFTDAAGTQTSTAWVVGHAGWGNTGDFVIGNQAFGGPIMLIQQDGNTGIGSTSPGAKLDVVGNVRTSTYYNFHGNPAVPTDTTAAIFDQTSIGPTISGLNVTFRAGTPTPAEVMRVDDSGNVGIGTTSPGYKLEVNGTGLFTGVLVLKGQASNYDATTGRTAYWAYDDKVALALEPAANDGAVAIFFKSIGNAPSDFGYIVFDEDYGEDGVTAGENSALIIGCENDGGGSSDHVRVKGRLVVEADMSSSDPAKAFQVKASNTTSDLFHINRAGGGYLSGTLNVTGDVVAYYSDMRLKTKLEDLTGAVSKIKMLNSFYYEPNEKALELGYKKERRIGLSAQEVQEVLPEAVSKASISHDPKVEEDYLSVDYAKLVPLLVEGIKELKAEIEELKKQIK